MADLHVSKKTIYKLYSDMQERIFIIPEFQRPYKWDKELCETLWNDIEDFARDDTLNGADYFLGTIVSYQNNDKNLEIIDGQQRITSLLLLLRAFYKKLEEMDQSKPNDPNVIGLKNQIAPCIWDVDSISQVVSDKTKIRIKSLVITEDDNDIFHKILENGICSDKAEDNYSKNFRFFKEKCDEYANKNPMGWEQLCITILKRCIILPIECDTSETALKIFSTLNDRGLPLADSDVFKAEKYKSITTAKARKEFTDDWNELTISCKNASISLDDVFRYYMHIIRARNNDNSKEVGLRKFYSGQNANYINLKDENLMKELLLLSNFWVYVNTRKDPSDDDGYIISDETKKYFHCLSWYPNDYWKYPVCVFFLKNINSTTFDKDLCSLLKMLIATLFTKFIYSPSINVIRDDVYNLYISIQNNTKWDINLNINDESFYKKLTDEFGSPKISRALILLDAYINKAQNGLIPRIFDIEHIFPKKWQDTNYNGWDFDDAKIYLESFGNKVVLEKKLNIQAGNNYFNNKKQKYASSKVASVIELSKLSQKDWLKEDIQKRERVFIKEILEFIKENAS